MLFGSVVLVLLFSKENKLKLSLSFLARVKFIELLFILLFIFMLILLERKK